MSPVRVINLVVDLGLPIGSSYLRYITKLKGSREKRLHDLGGWWLVDNVYY